MCLNATTAATAQISPLKPRFRSAIFFSDNRADNCNYGFWLGWSSETTVENNHIAGNRIAGVAIEHGHHNTIAGNTFEAQPRRRAAVGQSGFAARTPARLALTLRTARTATTARSRGNTFNRHDHAIHCWSARSERDDSVATTSACLTTRSSTTAWASSSNGCVSRRSCATMIL